VLIRAKMRWQNNGSDLPVVGSLKLYAVSTMNVLRVRLGLGLLRLLRLLLGRLKLLLRLSVASLLVDM
jgi:hypothetical protein